MTQTELRPALRRTPVDPGAGSTGPVGRPLALTAGVAGAVSALGVLVGCMAVAVAGWFASDAGGHGDTRDALRVASDAWLLAHGARLELASATITALPLGLTVLCLFVTFRLGGWAARTSEVDDLRAAVAGTLCLGGTYAVVATLTAVLASQASAQPHLGLACLGGLAVGLGAGGCGILAGSKQWPAWRLRVPETLLAVGTGAVSVVLLMLAAGSLLVAVTLLVDFGAAATVLSQLHVDLPGGLLYACLVLTVAPNAALLGGSYLVGPGFVVGTGTLVSPAFVSLGPVPAVPLLAALPDEGVAPAWTVALAATPVLMAALAAAVMLRRYPVPNYEIGALRGLLAGAVGAVGFTVAALLAGGAVGPGRMGDIGILFLDTLLGAVSAMGVGGMLGGLATTWWLRRRFLGR